MVYGKEKRGFRTLRYQQTLGPRMTMQVLHPLASGLEAEWFVAGSSTSGVEDLGEVTVKRAQPLPCVSLY